MLSIGGREFHVHEFVSFMGGRFPLPAANGVDGCLHKDRMSALDLYGFYCAIRSHESIDFHDSFESEAPREGRVFCRGANSDLPLGCRLLLWLQSLR